MRLRFVLERGSDHVEICAILQIDLSLNALALPPDPARELAPGALRA